MLSTLATWDGQTSHTVAGEDGVGICAGDLPVAPNHLVAGLHVLLAGCAVVTHGLSQFVLVVTRAGSYTTDHYVYSATRERPKLDFIKYRQTIDVGSAGLRLSISGIVCNMTTLRRSVRADCPLGVLHAMDRPQRLVLRFDTGLQGAREAAVVSVALDWASFKAGASSLQCQGNPIYGNVSAEAAMLTQLRKSWRIVGFARSLVFARHESACAVLRAAAPQSEVHCETRRRLPLPQHATWRQQRAVAHPDMDKNIYAAVCLVYARAIQAPFLALTDLDELPPGKLAAVLREKRGSSAVVRVFFDADHACGGACPSSDVDASQRCGKRKRIPWKPIVQPQKTLDVDTHGASVLDGYSQRWTRTLYDKATDVYGACLRHVRRSVSSASAAKIPFDGQGLEGGVRLCAGELPITTTLGEVVVTVAGCAANRRVALLVLAFEHLRREPAAFGRLSGHTMRLQRPQSHWPALRLSLNQCDCQLTWLMHSVRARCDNRGSRGLRLGFNHAWLTIQAKRGGAWTTASLRLSLRSATWDTAAHSLHCSASFIHGSLPVEAALIRRARKGWAQLGVGATLLFAQSATECEALNQLEGTYCEVRTRLALRWPPRLQRNAELVFHPEFEKNLIQQVCLAYAQVAGSRLVAFTDSDDVPSVEMGTALSTTTFTGHKQAGVRVFFDAERKCRGVCLCGLAASYSDFDDAYRRKCPGVKNRNPWKPIVVPSKTHDVGTHYFVATTSPLVTSGAWPLSRSGSMLQALREVGASRPFARASDVWCPCLHHAKRPENISTEVTRSPSPSTTASSFSPLLRNGSCSCSETDADLFRGSVRLMQMWFGDGSQPRFLREAMCRARQYAASHGYAYRKQTSRLRTPPNRSAASWQKVPLLLSEFAAAKATGSALVYVDADMQIVNHCKSVLAMIEPCGPQAQLILSTDWNALSRHSDSYGRPRFDSPGCCRGGWLRSRAKCLCIINGGMIIVRPTEWARALLVRSLESPECDAFGAERQKQWEQDCLQRILMKSGELPSHSDIVQANKEHRPILGSAGRVCVLPMDQMAPPIPYRAETSRPVVSRLLYSEPPPCELQQQLPWAVHFLSTLWPNVKTTKATLASQLASSKAWVYGDHACPKDYVE